MSLFPGWPTIGDVLSEGKMSCWSECRRAIAMPSQIVSGPVREAARQAMWHERCRRRREYVWIVWRKDKVE
jgi:hypothetical protein